MIIRERERKREKERENERKRNKERERGMIIQVKEWVRIFETEVQ